MSSDKSPDQKHKAGRNAPAAPAHQAPAWADSLKHLYKTIVEEPLPDSFQDLLDQLDDDESDKKGASDNGGMAG